MKIRYYYKVNSQGKPIIKSNIAGYFKPGIGKWKEIIKSHDDKEASCNSSLKYYVKIDYQGNPIDFSLIKRSKRPESDSERFLEIASDSCSI